MKLFVLLCLFVLLHAQYWDGNLAYLVGNKTVSNDTLYIMKVTRARSGYSFFAISKTNATWENGLIVVFRTIDGVSTATRVVGGRTRPFTGQFASNDDNIIKNCNVPDFNWSPMGYFVDDTWDGCLVNKKEFTQVFGATFYVTVGQSATFFPSNISDLTNAPIDDMSRWYTQARSQTVLEFTNSFGLPTQKLENLNMGIPILILCIYIILFVFLIGCAGQQPLKSRGVLPLMSWVFQFVVFAVTTMTWYTWRISDFAKYQIYILFFVVNTFQVLTFSTATFMFMRYVILTSVSQQKQFFSAHRNDEDPPKVHLPFRLLKTSGNWYVSFILALSLYVLIAICMVIAFASCEFTKHCSDRYGFYVYTFFMVVFIVLLVLTLVTDLILNRVKLSKCQFINLWNEDVFYMRTEVYGLGLCYMVPLYITCTCLIEWWPLDRNAPVAITILTSILSYSWMFYQFGFVLIITIIKFMIGLFQKKASWDACERVLKNPDARKLFMEFSKSEYSAENNMCYEDIQEYKEETDQVNKKKLASNIFATYLNGSHSTLEINIPSRECRVVKEKLDTGMAPQTLFMDIERGLMINLADTFSRFVFSREYMQLETRERFLTNTFGEMQ
jgi:hypothetical protein